jgi:hypothetical protein
MRFACGSPHPILAIRAGVFVSKRLNSVALRVVNGMHCRCTVRLGLDGAVRNTDSREQQMRGIRPTSRLACAGAGVLYTCAASATTINVDASCPLPAAIVAANTDATPDQTACAAGDGADTIVIPASGVVVDIPQPRVTSDIAFVGAGAAPALVSALGLHRLFFIGDDTHAPTVTFAHLVLQGGIARGGAGYQGAGGGAGFGGALFIHDGSVGLDAVNLVSNSATGGDSSGAPAFIGTNDEYGTAGGGGGGMFGPGGQGASSLGGGGGGGACGLPYG